MMNNYDEKIINIKETQKKLLEMVKVKIEEEGQIFNTNTKNIVDVLARDAEVIKKYEAIISAQKLIKKYTDDIKNASSIDEIKEIRKNLNCCINKVKKEMKNRGFDDVEFNNYCENVNKFRKRIAENIRFLKREEKINEIETLNENIDSLNEEELLKLKKLVKNEVSYGKRYMEKYGVLDKPKTIAVKNDINTVLLNENMMANRKSIMHFETYDSLQDFLNNRVSLFEQQYKIKKISKYNGGIIRNISIFNENLPKLICNKKRAKLMIMDYNLFCRKPELLGYSRYMSKHNSVLYNFKKAMKNGVLKNKEIQYEEEHNMIAEWIMNFCKSHHMLIKYNKSI